MAIGLQEVQVAVAIKICEGDSKPNNVAGGRTQADLIRVIAKQARFQAAPGHGATFIKIGRQQVWP